MINAEMKRGILSKDLQHDIEFIVEIPVRAFVMFLCKQDVDMADATRFDRREST